MTFIKAWKNISQLKKIQVNKVRSSKKDSIWLYFSRRPILLFEFLTKRGQLRGQKEISLIFLQNKKRPDPCYTRDQDVFSITDYSATG